jgi:hypothetical protein
MKMDDTVAAKPTRYNGTAFRSRLEARWAAFFDLAGWRWEYEPLDLRGWVPDFALIGKPRPIFVEVKPICWTGGEGDMRKLADHYPGLGKVRALIREQEAKEPHDWHEPDFISLPEVIAVGAYPHRLSDDWVDCCLGVFLREAGGSSPDPAALCRGYAPRQFDFHALGGWYAYRMGGEYKGDGHLLGGGGDEAEAAWREAGNIVQWHPKPAA